MEFEIKNMGLTIAVGGLLIGCICLMLLLLRKQLFKLDYRDTRRIYKNARRIPKFLLAAVGLAMIFGTGVLVEDFAQNITATHGLKYQWPWAGEQFEKLIDPDKKLRFRNFFEITNTVDSNYQHAAWQFWRRPPVILNCRYSPVACELLMAPTTNVITLFYVNKLKGLLQDTNDVVSNHSFAITNITTQTQCEDCVNGIYYLAKNITYQNSDYYQELGAIEVRTNFMRSIMFIFLFFGVFHLGFGVACLGLKLSRRLFKKKEHTPRGMVSRQSLYFTLLVAYFVLFLLARRSYQIENDSYNVRVFGYYTTLSMSANQSSGQK